MASIQCSRSSGRYLTSAPTLVKRGPCCRPPPAKGRLTLIWRATSFSVRKFCTFHLDELLLFALSNEGEREGPVPNICWCAQYAPRLRPKCDRDSQNRQPHEEFGSRTPVAEHKGLTGAALLISIFRFLFPVLRAPDNRNTCRTNADSVFCFGIGAANPSNLRLVWTSTGLAPAVSILIPAYNAERWHDGASIAPWTVVLAQRSDFRRRWICEWHCRRLTQTLPKPIRSVL